MARAKRVEKPMEEMDEKELMAHIRRRKRAFAKEMLAHKDNYEEWITSEFEKTRAEFPFLQVADIKPVTPEIRQQV